MRFYANSRGTTGVSIGPIGLLLAAPVYLVIGMAVALAWALSMAARGVVWLWERHEARAARRDAPCCGCCD